VNDVKDPKREAPPPKQEGAKPEAPSKVVEHYPPPDPDELPPPTFRQALIGYGSIILALVLLGVLLGVLMRVLR
jgi:hypothetical protein